jgi:hypothetical protein
LSRAAKAGCPRGSPMEIHRASLFENGQRAGEVD